MSYWKTKWTSTEDSDTIYIDGGISTGTLNTGIIDNTWSTGITDNTWGSGYTYSDNTWTINNIDVLNPLLDSDSVGFLKIKDGYLILIHKDNTETKLFEIKSGKEINSLMNVIAKKMLEQ